MVPVFKNVGERSTAKNYRPVSLLSVVNKVSEKLVNNRILDHLEKCDLFSDFQYGFRSSRSTADLLTVVSDRIARAFNRSGAGTKYEVVNSNLSITRRFNDLLLERITQLERNNLNNAQYTRRETLKINPVLSVTGISVEPDNLQSWNNMCA